MENRKGLLVQTFLTEASGRAERDAAMLMAEAIPPGKRVTLGGDKNYDTREASAAEPARTVAAFHSPFTRALWTAPMSLRRFGQPLDEDSLNQTHQIIIIAATLDESSERIVGYLNRYDIPINVICFQVFTHGTE
jgi:hypothetical protein